MKESKLNEDAAIYQKREQKSGKQKWQEMDSVQKKQYFLDYYLARILTGAAAVFAALFLVWHFLQPRDEAVLYVAVIDETLDTAEKETLTEVLSERYVTDPGCQRVFLDDSFYLQDGGLAKLQTYLHSAQVDVIIASQETWREFAGYGYFRELEGFLESENGQGELLYAAGYRETDDTEISFEDHETGQGEILAYGMDLSGSEVWAALSGNTSDWVLGIAANATNPEHAADFALLLLERNRKDGKECQQTIYFSRTTDITVL